MLDARIPMPAASASIPMPSYAYSAALRTTLNVVLFLARFYPDNAATQGPMA
jgi:hypothetical protein